MTSSCRAPNPAEQLRPPEVRQPRMPEAQQKGGTLGPTINRLPSTEPLQPRQSLTLLSKVGSSTHTAEAGCDLIPQLFLFLSAKRKTKTVSATQPETLTHLLFFKWAFVVTFKFIREKK